MSVTLNGNTYDADTDFVGSDGRQYSREYAATGLTTFPNSIFTDMLAELASATSIDGLSPGAAGGIIVSTGSAWVRATTPTITSAGAASFASLAVTGTSTLTGNVGVGTTSLAAIGLRVVPTIASGGTQYGAVVTPTVSTAAATAIGFASRVDTPASVFTVTDLMGIQVLNATKGAGSTITTQYGLYVEALTSGGTNIPIFTAGTGPWIMGATAKLRLDGSASGDTYITESSANVLDLYAGAAKQLSLTATTATVAGNLIVSGTGPHAIGGAVADYIQLFLRGSFTSGGSSTTAVAMRISPTIAAAAGDTLYHTYLVVGQTAGITTQNNSETIGVVSSAYFIEPNITKGATDTITTAATVYIENAPTEGAANYALFVDSGASRFDGSVLCQDALTTNSATAGLGYSTGAGGAVTQGTSRTTGVTLNKVCGAITLVSAAGSTTPASFTVTNSTVAATDVIRLSQKSGTDKYILAVTAVAAGSFEITFYTTGGTTTEQPVFNFAVMKAVAA